MMDTTSWPCQPSKAHKTYWRWCHQDFVPGWAWHACSQNHTEIST